MRISDFSTATWESGSNNNQLAIVTKGGKTYRLKAHSSPRWNDVSDRIAEKKACLRSCPDRDSEERLKKEIEKLEKSQRRKDAEDRMCDEYLSEKARMNKACAERGWEDRVFCAEDTWREQMDAFGNCSVSIEATRQCKVNGAFEQGSKAPLLFMRDFDEGQKMRMFAEFADTYALLHAKHIVHGDIKMTNMLIGDSKGANTACVIDFDAAFFEDNILFDNYAFLNNSIGGTLMSPEFSAFFYAIREDGLMGDDLRERFAGRISTKTDVFSFAIAMFECLYGQEYTPLANDLKPVVVDKAGIVCKEKDGNPMRVYDFVFGFNGGDNLDLSMRLALAPALAGQYPTLGYLFSWMTEFDPAQRPTMAEVRDVLQAYPSTDGIPDRYLPTPGVPGYKYNLSADPELVSIASIRPKFYRVVKKHTTFDAPFVALVKAGFIVPDSAEIKPVKAPSAPAIILLKSGKNISIEGGKCKLVEGTMTKYITFQEAIKYKLAVPGTYTDEQVADCQEQWYGASAQLWPEDTARYTLTEKGVNAGVRRDIGKGVHWYLVDGKSLNIAILMMQGYALMK